MTRRRRRCKIWHKNLFSWASLPRKAKWPRHPEMGNLAGIRIGLHLPDHTLEITGELEKRFETKHLFGTVTGGRHVTQARNPDIQKHTNGPWHTRDLYGTDEYWEHSGYKSWLWRLNRKSPLPEPLSAPLRVEIQIGTEVSQPWAEVQHNNVYKRSPEILTTPRMRRMIDAISVLAITTEIMFKELERSLDLVGREPQERNDLPSCPACISRSGSK